MLNFTRCCCSHPIRISRHSILFFIFRQICVSARAAKRNWTGKSYRFKSSHTVSSERQRQTRESVSWYNHDKLCHLHLSLYLIVSSMTNNNEERQRSIVLCSMDRRRCQNSFSFSLKLSASLLGWNDVVLSWVCGEKIVCVFLSLLPVVAR